MKLAAGAGRNGMWARGVERCPHRRIGAKLRRVESHERRREQKPRPGRDNRPIREPGTCAEGKAATNDPRGRRLQLNSTKSQETRGAKNRKGEPADGLGVEAGKTPQRDGPELGNSGRYGAAGKR